MYENSNSSLLVLVSKQYISDAFLIFSLVKMRKFWDVALMNRDNLFLVLLFGVKTHTFKKKLHRLFFFQG